MFNVGDMVKVIGPQSKADKRWVKSMNRFIGKTMIVSSVSNIGIICLDGSRFIFLDSWLDPIEDDEIIMEDLEYLV